MKPIQTFFTILSKYTPSGIVALIVCLLINGAFSLFPRLTELLYYRFVFQLVRVSHDYTFGQLNIPSFYPVFFLLIVLLVIFLMRKDRIKSKFSDFISFLAWVIVFFYVLWGFNYQRIPVENQLDLSLTPVDKNYLLNELTITEKQLIELRSGLSKDLTTSLDDSLIPGNLEDLLRKNLEALLKSWNQPVYGNVRVRKLRPKGLLLHLSTAGIYIPHVAEGHVDGGLHPISWPFTMTHEMAHGYGYTQEGDCEFIAYISCLNSDNAYIKYAANLGYYRYVRSEIYKLDLEEGKRIYQSTPLGVRNDIEAIREYASRYRDLMPKTRDAIYEAYLKTHGVKEGLKSYSRIILLSKAYKAKNNLLE